MYSHGDETPGPFPMCVSSEPFERACRQAHAVLPREEGPSLDLLALITSHTTGPFRLKPSDNPRRASQARTIAFRFQPLHCAVGKQEVWVVVSRSAPYDTTTGSSPVPTMCQKRDSSLSACDAPVPSAIISAR